jgi:putative phage-type endonuclease
MMEQKSPEWFAARLGKATASRIADVMAKTKTGYGASRENYLMELALERITNAQAPSFMNAAMQWGVEQEPFARSAYEAATGNFVFEVGMIDHPTIPMSGASPDGLLGVDGLIEIKCPESKQHLKTLSTRKPDMKYIYQMQWQMACTGRDWCHFTSYDPRFPEHLQLIFIEVERDDELIGEIETEVRLFLDEVTKMVERITK